MACAEFLKIITILQVKRMAIRLILHNPVLDYEWSSRRLFAGFCDFKLEYDGYGNTKN